MDAESVNEDEDLQAEISFELSKIDVNLNSNEDTDASVTDTDSTTDVDLASQDIKSFKEFQHRLTSQREAFDQQLENCAQLLHSTDDKIASVNRVNLTHLVEEYGVEGEDEEQFRARIYKEIDADESDEEEYSDISVDVVEADTDGVEKVEAPMLTDGIPQHEESNELLAIEDKPRTPSVGDESKMVVLYKENSLRDLQRQAREKLAILDQRQEVVLQKAKKEQQLRMEYEQSQAELNRCERQHRVDLVKQETEKVQKLAEERELQLQRELKRGESHLSALSQHFEAQIYKLEKQTEVEKNKLKAEIDLITERRQLQEKTAATRIQATYRGYRVRLKHGPEVKQLVEHRLHEIEERKIEKANQRIEEMKTLQRQKDEEKLRAEQEKKRLKEEAERKELQAKAAKEKVLQEKKEREAEEKRLEEERKKMEQERKEEEKRKKKEERERLKREKAEKKRLQLEQRELERKQKEMERQLREQEEKKRLEEENERKREEEQKLLEKKREEKEEQEREVEQKDNCVKDSDVNSGQYKGDQQDIVGGVDIECGKSISSALRGSHEQTNSVQEERVHIDPKQPCQGQRRQNGLVTNESQQKETESKNEVKLKSLSGLKPALVGQNGSDPMVLSSHTVSSRPSSSLSMRNERQTLHLAEEKAEKEKKAKEYQNWMEERKAKMKAGVTQQPSTPKSSFLAVDVGKLQAKMEERRLRWIQECQPWSQMSAKALGAADKVKRSFKRPSSAAKKLEPVDEALLLEQSGQNSLSKVEAVQLKDLPGCRLSTLSKCRSLKAVNLEQSAVCAIDSLDSATSLFYLHLSGNAIDSLYLISSSLSYLNVSSNNLKSMRGFESCANIRYLNMSGNKIAKLASMSCYKQLHTLDMSHNELISARGVEECVTLQVVDLSANHLTNLEDIGSLCLLRRLTASANNIMEIPRLTNCVQLESLQLDDNSVSSLDGLAYFWLPSLIVVNLSVNGISTLQQLHGSFNIRDLDLSNNQLIDCRNIHEGLKYCVRLEQLSLKGNPAVSNDIQRRQVTAALPQLKTLDGEPSSHHSPLSLQSEILCMCDNSLRAFTHLEQQHHLVVGDHLAQNSMSNAELLRELEQMPHYYNSAFTLAENVRYAHEFGSMSFEIPEKRAPVSSKDLFNAKLAAVENSPAAPPGGIPSNAKDLFERKLKATLESTPLKVSTENMKLLKESTSPRPTSKHGRHRTKASSRSSTPRLSHQSLPAASGGGAQSTVSLQQFRRNEAATKIQATWRGYSFRLRLMSALEHAKEDSGASDEEVEEVDLTSFEYNLDDDWLPPDVPHLPQRHAVLPPKPAEWHSDDQLLPTAWASPAFPPADSGRHLDPPLSSMSGELSHRSKREEMIAQDWGFKDSHTAELMMKRAKKLKYNSQRRKKLDKLGPMGRYELQKKILDNIEPPKVLAPVRKAPKKEYFKALEEEARKKNWTKVAEKDSAIERTFEWVHTQVSDGPLGHRVDREERVSSGESQLPYMDKRLLEGGRTQLVNSPLEIMSVNSYGPSSADSRGKSSTQTDGRNYSGYGATGHALSKPPSHDRHKGKPPQGKTKKEVDTFNAWGTGKKRTNR